MTIRESSHFRYNGIDSRDFGIQNVNLEGGMLEENYLPNKNILEEKIRGNNIPYFMGVEYDPLEFSVNFAFDDVFDTAKIRKVAKWLNPSYYAPLVFSEKTSHVYYCQPINGNLIHNSLKQGYVSIDYRCNAPWAFTPVIESQEFDYSNNTVSGSTLTFDNVGDLPTKPLIEIEIVADGAVKIVNTSNRGQTLELTGLAVGENLVIDCETKSITTDLIGVYRYLNMSPTSEFLTLVEGINYLQIYGKVKIRFKYQSPIFS